MACRRERTRHGWCPEGNLWASAQWLAREARFQSAANLRCEPRGWRRRRRPQRLRRATVRGVPRTRLPGAGLGNLAKGRENAIGRKPARQLLALLSPESESTWRAR